MSKKINKHQISEVFLTPIPGVLSHHSCLLVWPRSFWVVTTCPIKCVQHRYFAAYMFFSHVASSRENAQGFAGGQTLQGKK